VKSGVALVLQVSVHLKITIWNYKEDTHRLFVSKSMSVIRLSGNDGQKCVAKHASIAARDALLELAAAEVTPITNLQTDWTTTL
jgi:hypothetical protein